MKSGHLRDRHGCCDCHRIVAPPRYRRGVGEIPWKRYLAAIWLAVASLAFLWLVFELRHILFNVVVAAFLAVVLSSPVAWLQRRRVKRGLAITIVMLGVFLAVTGIAAAIATPLAGQSARVAKHAPAYLSQAEHGRGPVGRLARRFHLENQLRKAVPAVSKSLSRLPSRLLSIGRGVASTGARTAIVLVLTVFVLVEGPHLIAGLERMVPSERLAMVQRIGTHVAETITSYTIGILALALLNGIVTFAVLELMRVPFSLPLALWAGIVDILPIIGGLLAIVVVALFAFVKSVVAGIVVVAVMLVYQQVKNHVLYPVVVGRAVQLNALVVLLAVLAGAELSGIAGAILAIPVAAVIHVALTEFLGPRLPWIAQEEPTVHAAEPPAAPI
jgi:predicted PurR-regulated permease PerM